MNKRMELMTTGIVFCVMLFAATSYAQQGMNQSSGSGPQKRGGFNKEKMFDNIIAQLNLTSEQQRKIKEHQTEHRNKMKTLMESLRSKKQELRTELESQQTDEKKIKALLAEIEPLMAQQLELRVGETLSMKKILTPEQYQTFQQLIKQHRPKMGMGRGFRKQGFGGQCPPMQQGESVQQGPPLS